MSHGKIICDMSTGIPRPIVPSSYRRQVFDSLHSLSHPGIRATQRLITSRFVWPNINSDVRKWARSCIQCQRSKIHRHTVTPPSTFATPDNRFERVHLDLVGPLAPSQGYAYLVTIIDRLLVGRKPFLSLILLHLQLLEPLSVDGSRVLEYPRQSPLIVDVSLNLPCGRNSWNF